MRLMDREVYSNLMKLKNYKGNVEDLGLTFTIDDEILNKECDLVPNGSQVSVTNQNVISYLYQFANHKMNLTIKRQLSAFVKGFNRVLNRKWLQIFSEDELEIIINGSESVIDVGNMVENTEQKPQARPQVLAMFAEVARGFDNQQRQMLLKFITSYKNPPLFGFDTLFPKMTIRKRSFWRIYDWNEN